jgi:hypothetical protein
MKTKIKVFLVLFLLVILVLPFIIGTSINMGQYNNGIIINGNFSDWESLQKISDPMGDATTGNADDELLLSSAATGVLHVFDNINGVYLHGFNITVAGSIYSAAVGDINGDGKNEIVISYWAGGNVLQFFEDTGSGWSNYYTYTGPCGNIGTYYAQSLRIKNVDDDNNLEVVYKCGYDGASGELSVLDESLGIVTPEQIDVIDWYSYYTLAVGDLDNDGYPEIFVGDDTNDQFRVYEYNGVDYVNTGSFNYGTDMGVSDMAITGDANGDGIDDLIVCGNSKRVHIFNSEADNTYQLKWESAQIDSFTQACGIGDFNGNGKIDIVTSGSGSATETAYYEKDDLIASNYAYTKIWSNPTKGVSVQGGATGDFDSDGRTEWAFEDSDTKVSDNNVIPYGPPFDMTTISLIRPFRMTTGDVDNDGGTGGVNQDDFDMTEVSLANDDEYIYAYIKVNGNINPSGDEYYRLFINHSNSPGGIYTTPDSQEILPIAYDYMVTVHNNQCEAFHSSGIRLFYCNFSNNANELEISLKIDYLQFSLGEVMNVVFETGNATDRYDITPDFPEIIDYYLTDGTQPSCGNGVCDGELGEDCSTCPADCIAGEFTSCGDGTCHGSSYGETCTTCSSDCFSETVPQGDCSDCHKGRCDGRCTGKDGPSCADCTTPLETCCGDGVCDGNEDSGNCAVDCGIIPLLNQYCCGDGVCEGVEDLNNCFFDCYVYVPPECSSDSDCADDGESCTTEVCLNPGTPQASCTSNWPSCGINDGCCGSSCGSEDPDCATPPDCSTCHKGVCDGSCNPRKDGPGCPDCTA